MSEKTNIYQKLMSVQSELKAPKNQYNSFGKYNYRSCEDILEGLKPLLKANKAIIILNDVIEQIGDRYYIKAVAAFVDIETGEKLEVTALAREEESKKGMDGSQVTGTASSYARKYALNGLFCIDDTKDADATNKHGKDENKGNVAPITQKQQKPRGVKCEGCGQMIVNKKVYEYSMSKFKKALCMDCQKKETKEVEANV